MLATYNIQEMQKIKNKFFATFFLAAIFCALPGAFAQEMSSPQAGQVSPPQTGLYTPFKQSVRIKKTDFVGNSIILILSVIFFLLGILLFYNAFYCMHRYILFQNIPRSKIRSMAMGLVEIQGNAQADQTIVTLSQTKCVYYKYKVEEYKMYSSGNKRTHGWDTIYMGEKRIPFFEKDETGQVYVDPKEAVFDIFEKKVLLQKAGAPEGIDIINELKNWDNSKAMSINVSGWGLRALNGDDISFNVGDKKYSESYIEPQEPLFIIGTAANDPQAPNVVLIKKGENAPTFFISNTSKKEEVDSLKSKMIKSFAICLFILVWEFLFLMRGHLTFKTI